MSLKLSDKVTRVAHHIDQGAVDMYAVDANSAAARHPDEWRLEPWSPEDASAARKRLHARRVKEADELGQPAPEPFIEPEMSDEDRREFEEWKASREAAAARLKEAEKEEAEKTAREAQIAADRATVNSPPPRPDPARRKLTGAAKANAERTAARKAAEEEASKDKLEDDRKSDET